MDWLDIHSFVTVAREQSISKASRVLHLSQPSLTARLKKIEAEYNVALFNRTWKGVQLTAHGQRFLVQALKVLEEFDALHERVNNTGQEPEASKLRLGISRPLGASFISPVVQRLRTHYPELKYEVLSDKSSYLLELIAIGQLHLGIVPYTKALKGLSSIPLFEEQFVLLAPKQDTILSGLPEGEWRDYLLSKTFLLHTKAQPFRKYAEAMLTELLGRMPERIVEVNDTSPLLTLVSHGMGYSLLPSSYIFNAFQVAAQAAAKEAADGKPLAPASHESIPYNIFLSPLLPRRKIYLVHHNALEEEPRWKSIIEDIEACYVI